MLYIASGVMWLDGGQVSISITDITQYNFSKGLHRIVSATITISSNVSSTWIYNVIPSYFDENDDEISYDNVKNIFRQ